MGQLTKEVVQVCKSADAVIQAHKKTWCFFDLDGTLVLRDTFLPFVLGWLRGHQKRILRVSTIRVSLLPISCVYFALAGKERSCIKEAFLSAFMRGASRTDIDAFAKLFWESFLPRYQNDVVISRLNWHYIRGHYIYIITASFDFYVKYLTEIWPVHGVISTQAEWDGDVLTGKILGKNCRGIEKIKRIENDLGVNLRDICYYAYTDSKSDIPLLKYARHAFMVNPSKIERWDGQ